MGGWPVGAEGTARPLLGVIAFGRVRPWKSFVLTIGRFVAGVGARTHNIQSNQAIDATKRCESAQIMLLYGLRRDSKSMK